MRLGYFLFQKKRLQKVKNFFTEIKGFHFNELCAEAWEAATRIEQVFGQKDE